MLIRGLTLFTIGTLLLVGACFPAKETFFQPSAESGTLTRVACKGQVGFPGIIRFEPDGVLVGLFASKQDGQLRVHFRIPYERSVSFKPSAFVLSDDDGAHKVQPATIEMRKLEDPFHKQNVPVAEWQILNVGNYDLDFNLPIKEVTGFSFLVPPLKINEKEITLPPIKFVLTSGWYIYPINC